MPFLSQILTAFFVNSTGSSSRKATMPKLLFGVLVSLASVVGYQVIQKYKNTGLETVAKKFGITPDGNPSPNNPANGTLSVLNQIFSGTTQPSTSYGSNPSYGNTPPSYGSTSYGSYGQTQYPQNQPTYPQQRPPYGTNYPNSNYPAATQPTQQYTQGYSPSYQQTQAPQYPGTQYQSPQHQSTQYQQPQYPIAGSYGASNPASQQWPQNPQSYPQNNSYPTQSNSPQSTLQPIVAPTYGNPNGLSPIAYPNNPSQYPPANGQYPSNANTYPGANGYNNSFNTQGQASGVAPPVSANASIDPINPVPNATSNGTIKIGSFNIQVFGKSKLEHRDPVVMGTIVDLVSRYDVVAIQELRAADQDTTQRFLQMLNSHGPKHFDAYVGPREGHSVSKEQYVFVFNTDTIEIARSACYQVPDPGNYFERPPVVGFFRAKQAPPNQAFTFALVNIHTSPDEAKSEVEALAKVITDLHHTSQEDDIILLGDLNAGDINTKSHIDALTQNAQMTPLISGQLTMVKAKEANDNILIFRNNTTEYTGKCGVIDFEQEYHITRQQALEVSDHRPIWGEFSIYEQPRR